MTTNDRLPPELDCSNLAREWPVWKRTFQMYMIATGKDVESESKKIATFLWLVGARAMDIYSTLFPNDGSTNGILGKPATAKDTNESNATRTLQAVIEAFDGHCIPRKNGTMESFKYNTIVQKERQPFVEFETELRKQIQFCEYKCTCGLSYEERMLRDRIIIGVCDKKLQLQLLDGKDQPVNDVIDKCKAFEAANKNKLLLDKGVVQTVNSVEDQQLNVVDAIARRCYNCGALFGPGHLVECKAKRVSCNGCGKVGHFARFCKFGKAKWNNNNKQSGLEVKNKIEEGKKETKSLIWGDTGNNGEVGDGIACSLSQNVLPFRINSNSIRSSERRWKKTYQIGNQKVEFKIDTGSDVNCVPINVVKKTKTEIQDKELSYPVFDYSNNKVKIYGTVDLNCLDLKTKKSLTTRFLVVEDTFEPILGLDSSVKFNLIRRLDIDSVAYLPTTDEQFVETFRDVFDGLGKFPSRQSIILKEDAEPSLHYKKRIPHSLLEPLSSELKRLVREEIISPVSYPTDWVNNLQIVEKSNGKLRICLDPKPLNKAIKREHFLIPTIDDFTSHMADQTVFTVLDLSSGFWQMELDQVSSDLTTFMTPFGRFKFNRVPFGLNCAPEMFQRNMVQIFGDIPGVLVYFDDIAVMGQTERDHDRTLSLVIERARKNGVKFNSEKIQYRKSQVEFMGHVLSCGSVKPKNKYREAICRMKKPENKQDVMRLLGLFKYLAKFIPNLSKRSTALRNLTQNNVAFEWNEIHEREFRDLLEVVTSDPVLAIYDKNKPVVVQTDASKDGLGCVLTQGGQPVAYASRTLSKNEQKWAQIEKELLAIVFACERFHYFLYGREFTVESDHKPLETLVKRDMDDVTARLQRMFMFLLKYPKLSVIYKPGKAMLVADCLSRAQLPHVMEMEELSCVIHTVTKAACLSEENYKTYLSTIEREEQYKRICIFVTNGWPTYHKLDNFSQEFYKFKSELHFENGLLFRNHRLVIPTGLQKKIAMWLHAPHLGIEKTLARARLHYWWPGMNKQIKDIVLACETCETFKRNNQKEPLVQEETPEYPLHIAAMDIFEYAGKNFISIIDAYSGFLMVEHVEHKSASHIIRKLRKCFNASGYPTKIKCDNNPFNSDEFDRFVDECNMIVQYSSPRYPQSNGLAEKGVAIAKNILKRCYENNETTQYQYRILEYNTTPVASMQLAPCQLFNGRLLKTKMPVSKALLCRNNLNESQVQQKIKEKRMKQKYYFDRSAKALPLLKVGDLVIFKKNSHEWNYGTIVGNVNDRSYIVKDSFDNHYRRNRRFIAKTKNSGFNASDMLFEEHIKNGLYNDNSNMKEIQIIPSPITGHCDIQHHDDTTCEAEDSLLPVDIDTNNVSSDAYETAGSDESEADVDGHQEVIQPVPNQVQDNHRSTRSGRIVRPPIRYRN